jgi:transforming growth factor-beta-induced protein
MARPQRGVTDLFNVCKMNLRIGVAAMALAVAGCGSDSSDSSSGDADAAITGGAGGEGAGGGAGGEVVGGSGGENLGGAGGEAGGAGGGGGGEPALPSIAEIAQADDRFETLVQAAVAADLVGALNGDTDLTVFAPTDDAFAEVPPAVLETLLGDPAALTAVLTYHAVPGVHLAAEVVETDSYTTLQGADLAITVEGDVVRVNQAQIIEADIRARNGVIHVIDSVLMPPEEPALPSIAEIAQADDRFETLVQAAVAAGLVEALNGDTDLTVFAPTDDAFAEVPPAVLETLLGDPAALTAVLTYHAVPGVHLAAEVVATDSYTTLQGSDLDITVEGDVVRVNQAQIIETDIMARNGVIHVIDSVLMPAEEPAPQTIVEIAVGNPDFETLVAAVTAAGLVETLSGEGPFTVFAPTDDAFAALPEGTVEALLGDIPTLTDILTYHVIAGEVPAAEVVAATELTMLNGDIAEITLVDGNAYIDGAQIVVTDIQASNGIIHVIDTVMMPPEEAPALQTIVEIAVGNPDFETLVAAVTAAGLVETLSGEGPFTVFAPTDDAFAALPEGTVEALLGDIPTLTDILTYHVIAGEVPAAEVVAATELTMLNGDIAEITLVDGRAYIDGAEILITDIPASNGIIHVIDTVMLPPEEAPALQTIVEIAVGNPDFETLVAAVTAAGLVETLSGEGPFTVFAPTDDAFAALPAGTVDALLQDIPALTDVLTYHVISGEVPAADVVAATELTMLNGDIAAITLVDGRAYIDGAEILITDIPASNGIIHAIGAVMLP